MASLVAGEPLRVLLVSPHANQREEVGEALQGAGEHRFYWVSQPDLALTRAQGLAPHVIFVDDDLGVDAPELAALIRRLSESLPECAVLLLASPAALSLAQAAMLAGARAFISKPVTAETLLAVLRPVLSRRLAVVPPSAREPAVGRVIVFCAPKGGTGRTTLAINTAVSLREVTREPVALVDADYAAPAIDVALNLRGQRDIRDLLPKLNQLDADLISSVLATHSSGVRVLLAPPPDALDYPPTIPQVQQVTAWLKRTFPWVLVDLGLPLDESAYAFLDAADRVVMSVLPEMVGMRNAKLMLAQFEQRNYPPGKVWPLLNRDDLPGGVKRPDVAAYLGRELSFAIPNDQELATETVNRGVPMVIAHRRRPVAQAYRRFAGLLADERKVDAAVPAVPPVIVSAPVPNSDPSGVGSPDGSRASVAASAPPRPRRRLLYAGLVTLLILLALLIAGPLALRALNGSSAPPPPPAAAVSLAPAEDARDPTGVPKPVGFTTTPASSPTSTPTPSPTVTTTTTDTTTPSATATATATRPRATRRPTATRVARATATPVVLAGSVSPPALVAPPTTATTLSADLAPLYGAGQFRNSQLFWSVIVAQEGRTGGSSRRPPPAPPK